MKPSRRLTNFWRTLRYLRPQRRRAFFAILLSLGTALTFAASLSTVTPILMLFVSSTEGPRSAVYLLAAERAVGAELTSYRAEKYREISPEAIPLALVVSGVATGAAPAHADLSEGTILFPADPAHSTRLAFLEALANDRQDVELMALAPSEQTPKKIWLARPSLSTKQAFALGALRWAGTFFSADTSPRATRMALMVVFAGLFVVVVLNGLFTFGAEYLIAIASHRAVMDIRRDMYRVIMHLPLGWFGQHLSETLSRVVTDCKEINQGYQALFGKLTTEPMKVVVLLVCALLLNWRLTLMVMVAAPIGGLVVAKLGKGIRKANKKLLAGYAQMMGVINAALSGIRVVRAYNNQGFERRRAWNAERQLLKQLLKMERLDAMTTPLLAIFGSLIFLSGLVWLADHVFSGRQSPEEFLGLAAFLVVIFDSVRKITAVYPRLARADGAAQRVFDLIDRPIEEEKIHRHPPLKPLQNAIEFRNVSFTYPHTDRPALSHVQIVIKKGQKVALVGPNGSGKTTCINLLERFYECSDGKILIDEQNIAQHSIESLRNQISLITQDAVVFAVSAFENIAYGVRNASMDAVVAAAQKAHAHEFIERLPDGYQTVLGEFGATLSGGERQRLSLARAIFRNAPIFIFDEATSQVDVDSEKKILQATQEFMRGRTSVVIAHRIATIIDADQIVVFDQGRVADTGRHAELLVRCELYKTLYQTHAHPV